MKRNSTPESIRVLLQIIDESYKKTGMARNKPPRLDQRVELRSGCLEAIPRPPQYLGNCRSLRILEIHCAAKAVKREKRLLPVEREQLVQTPDGCKRKSMARRHCTSRRNPPVDAQRNCGIDFFRPQEKSNRQHMDNPANHFRYSLSRFVSCRTDSTS